MACYRRSGRLPLSLHEQSSRCRRAHLNRQPGSQLRPAMDLNWKRPLSYYLLPILVFLAFVGFPRLRPLQSQQNGPVPAGQGIERRSWPEQVGVSASLRPGSILQAFGRVPLRSGRVPRSARRLPLRGFV